MTEIAHVYAADITKAERDADGNLNVYGKASGPDLDLDEQRCDPGWLKRAMPDWMSWGNVREMHQPVVAGIGVELTEDGNDNWFLKSQCIDSNVASKLEAGAYKGYSIGIKDAKVVKDATAPKGRIVGGTIVEVSYVDRPCNPTAVMSLVKMAKDGLEPVDADGELATEQPEPTAAEKLAEQLATAPEDVLTKIAALLAGDDSQPVPPDPAPEPDTTKTSAPDKALETEIADLRKSVTALTESKADIEKRYAALNDRVEKVLATPIPGTPYVTVPAGMRDIRANNEKLAEAARLRKMADEIRESDVAASYRARAIELEAEANSERNKA